MRICRGSNIRVPPAVEAQVSPMKTSNSIDVEVDRNPESPLEVGEGRVTKRIAVCAGKIARIREILHFLEDDEQYEKVVARQSGGEYTVLTELIVKGARLFVQKEEGSFTANAKEMNANVGVLRGSVGAEARTNDLQRERMRSHLQIDTNKTVLRIFLTGGTNRWCSGNSTLEIWVVTRNKKIREEPPPLIPITQAESVTDPIRERIESAPNNLGKGERPNSSLKQPHYRTLPSRPLRLEGPTPKRSVSKRTDASAGKHTLPWRP